MSTTDTADRFRALVEGDGPVAVEDAHALFDAGAPVACDEMLGEWDGGIVPTGHPGEGQLSALGWVGKTFRDADDVDPIVSRGDDGGRAANPILGTASLRAVEHRGVVTATMVYDKHPIFDHFRRVDADTVLGLMDRKGEPAPLFFWLRRAGA